MKSSIPSLASLAMAAALASPAQGAGAAPALNVSLACQIQSPMFLAITNTTGGAIPSGTRIDYSYLRNPDRLTIPGHLTSGLIAPGQVIRRHILSAFSCKAWFRKQPVLAR